MSAFPLASFRRAWLPCPRCGAHCLFLRRWWGFEGECGARVQGDGAEFTR